MTREKKKCEKRFSSSSSSSRSMHSIFVNLITVLCYIISVDSVRELRRTHKSEFTGDCVQQFILGSHAVIMCIFSFSSFLLKSVKQ